MKLKFLIALLLISTSVFAQREIGESNSLKDRGYAGVGFGGLAFGSDTYYGRYFSIGASALGGYMLTESLSAGVGLDYQFTSYGDIGLRNHIVGGYPFLRVRVTDFFAQADYAVYTLKANLGTDQEARVQAERFFVGIGYAPRSSGNTTFNILLSYDLLYVPSGPFVSPISLRAFLTFH